METVPEEPERGEVMDEQPLESPLPIFTREYSVLRRKLVFFFRNNNCLDPENLADEVLTRVAVNLFGNNPKPLTSKLGAYAYGVAANLLKEYRKKRFRHEIPLGEAGETAHISTQSLETTITVDQILRDLSQKDREVLDRYYLKEHREGGPGESRNTLRIKAHRAIKKIRKRFLPAAGRE